MMTKTIAQWLRALADKLNPNSAIRTGKPWTMRGQSTSSISTGLGYGTASADSQSGC